MDPVEKLRRLCNDARRQEERLRRLQETAKSVEFDIERTAENISDLYAEIAETGNANGRGWTLCDECQRIATRRVVDEPERVVCDDCVGTTETEDLPHAADVRASRAT